MEAILAVGFVVLVIALVLVLVEINFRDEVAQLNRKFKIESERIDRLEETIMSKYK